MLSRAFIVPTAQLGRVIAWIEARCPSAQAPTIDVQSRVIAIECRPASAADQIAAMVVDRPGWRRDQDFWLFFEVLEPLIDFEDELDFGRKVVGNLGSRDEYEVGECRVVEIGFPSEVERIDFRVAEEAGHFFPNKWANRHIRSP